MEANHTFALYSPSNRDLVSSSRSGGRKQGCNMQNLSIGVNLASNACQSCKKQKRRCTKQLPKCSLCARLSRDCDYDETPIIRSSENLQARITQLEVSLMQKQQQLDQLLQQVNSVSHATARQLYANPFEKFPVLFFLDYDMFSQAKLTIPRPMIPIPETIYGILGNIGKLRSIAQVYFSNIHSWFPVLSRRRYEIMLGDDQFVPTPDVALVLAAMHLLADMKSTCQAIVKTDVYWHIKNYVNALETNGFMTCRLLQANILLTLYELGHAIYPAAYLSMGKCSNMGKSFGLDSRKHAPQMLLIPGSWAEQEEVRRSWWAVLLLDRYMHLTFPGHALNTEDPHQDEVLPAEDTLFDQAEMCGNEPLHVASPTSLKAGPFTRSCQAAYLMGKVVNVLNEFTQESETRFTLAIQVYHTVTAFSKVVQAEFDACPESFATPMALTYSALIALCDPFCCTVTNRGAHTVEETELQILCIRGLKTTSDDAARLALQLRSSMTTRHSAISPLIGHCLYVATVTFAWRVYEGEKSTSQAHDVLREALSSFNGRWAVGMEYMNALDRAKDLLYPSPAHQLIGGPPGLTS